MNRERVGELCELLLTLARERGQHDMAPMLEALQHYASSSPVGAVTLLDDDLRRLARRAPVAVEGATTWPDQPAQADQPTELAHGGVTFIDSANSQAEHERLPTEEIDRENPDVSLTASGTARYIVLREIARGGMGRIVEAVDRDLRRTVAMKLVPQERMHRASIEQFLQEAQITAQLEHPGVVPVYDLGRMEVDGESHLYYTMKRVPGRPMSALIRELHQQGDAEAFDVELRRLVRVISAVCQVLDYAHARDVLHLDLKPANIMVGDFGEVYIVDWGIAEVREVDDAGLRTVLTEAGLGTRVGRVSGTPQFMAPELLDGEVSVRCDVYGLGAVLYSVLVGRPPFHGANPLVALSSAARGEHIPPSEMRPDLELPERLEQLCMEALTPDPDHRVPTMRELHRRLVEWLDGYEHRKRRTGEAAELAQKGVELTARHLTLSSQLRLVEETEADPLLRLEGADRGTLRSEARTLFVLAERALTEALEVSENEVAARTLLELYADRTRNAGLLGVGVAEASFLAQRIEHGSTGAMGLGTLRIRTAKRGVCLELVRLGSSERRELGTAPQLALDVPPGDYLLCGEIEGAAPIRWAFSLAPDQDLDLRLPVLGMLAIEVSAVPVTVAAGPDDDEPSGFFATRAPIDASTYLAFLNTLPAAESARRVPRTPVGDPLWVWEGARWRMPRQVDALGIRWRATVPVVCVSRDDAMAFCAWKTEQTGLRWRLPSPADWDAMMRGSLSWAYPWGRDPMRWPVSARELAEAGINERDTSIFGIVDAVGQVGQWVDSDGWPTARGGSWLDPDEARRLSTERVVPPGTVSPALGFRCVIG